ncbi:hypothetical protein AXF14_08575 [Actinomyces radicidentis]|uniref:Uncharacterized protein n=1 Tax=Actinomyces radicidentis TaxID=111015 RepID=A0A0X8JF08_ACTRD|nr:hypothetical protein [Actinomyces radicidentis]AMD87630.1 hypothetical protein AXF14_08575 [Actinomyces radicidentis]
MLDDAVLVVRRERVDPGLGRGLRAGDVLGRGGGATGCSGVGGRGRGGGLGADRVPGLLGGDWSGAVATAGAPLLVAVEVLVAAGAAVAVVGLGAGARLAAAEAASDASCEPQAPSGRARRVVAVRATVRARAVIVGEGMVVTSRSKWSGSHRPIQCDEVTG